MLDFETVFFSVAQWERQSEMFGLRTFHYYGEAGATTPDGKELTMEEAKEYYSKNIRRDRLMLWQENIMPAEDWEGHYMWLKGVDGDSVKVRLDLVSEGKSGRVDIHVYRVSDQDHFDLIQEKGIFNPIGGERCVHFIGPSDPVPELDNVPKYMVLHLSEDRTDKKDGTRFKVLFNTYEDAKYCMDCLNETIHHPINTESITEGKYIIVDQYYNEWHPYKSKEECCKPQEFYIERYEALKKLHS